MGELVGDLLELSRLESGTLGLEIGPFSLAEAGGQVASQLLPIAIERGIHLSTALPPRLRVACGDRRRVEQILTNLAANALKFTPSGGTVELEATLRRPGRDRDRPGRRGRHPGRGPGPDLRAVPPDGRPRADHRHRARTADRARSGPPDGRRPRCRVRARCRIGVRPRPARPGGGRRPRSSPPRWIERSAARRDGLEDRAAAPGVRRQPVARPTDGADARSSRSTRSGRRPGTARLRARARDPGRDADARPDRGSESGLLASLAGSTVFHRLGPDVASSWITRLTPSADPPSVRHPHRTHLG